jgi:hypothetical protein
LEVRVVPKITRRLWCGALVLIAAGGCNTAATEKPQAKSSENQPAEKPAPVALAPALQLVPADALGFSHVRVRDLAASEACTDIRRLLAKAGPDALQLLSQKYVPAPADVESVTMILPTAECLGTSIFFGPADRVTGVLAVTTVRPVDREQLKKAFGSDVQESRYNGQSYFRIPANHAAFQVVNERLFVVASEKALRRWLLRPAGDGQNGPLQLALREANQKHAVVLGLNPAALPKHPFGLFRSSTTTFQQVGSTIGEPATQPAPRTAAGSKSELWTSVAQPLLRARCLTLTVDVDRRLRAAVQLNFDGDADADSGARAVRAGLQAAREALADAAADLEREVRDGPRTFSFGPSAARKPAGPRALFREVEQAAADVAFFVGVGLYRSLDEQLQALAVERQGKSVRVQASAPVDATALVFAVSAITALGRKAETTFTTVGSSIGSTRPSLEPKANPRFTPVGPVLPPGTRAVAVRVGLGPAALGTAALPGTRVDLIHATTRAGDRSEARVLVENVLVVAADVSLQGDGTAVVTLALTPEQAVRVTQAQGTGSLSVVLRRFGDEKR